MPYTIEKVEEKIELQLEERKEEPFSNLVSELSERAAEEEELANSDYYPYSLNFDGDKRIRPCTWGELMSNRDAIVRKMSSCYPNTRQGQDYFAQILDISRSLGSPHEQDVYTEELDYHGNKMFLFTKMYDPHTQKAEPCTTKKHTWGGVSYHSRSVHAVKRFDINVPCMKCKKCKFDFREETNIAFPFQISATEVLESIEDYLRSNSNDGRESTRAECGQAAIRREGPYQERSVHGSRKPDAGNGRRQAEGKSDETRERFREAGCFTKGIELNQT